MMITSTFTSHQFDNWLYVMLYDYNTQNINNKKLLASAIKLMYVSFLEKKNKLQ